MSAGLCSVILSDNPQQIFFELYDIRSVLFYTIGINCVYPDTELSGKVLFVSHRI